MDFSPASRPLVGPREYPAQPARPTNARAAQVGLSKCGNRIISVTDAGAITCWLAEFLVSTHQSGGGLRRRRESLDRARGLRCSRSPLRSTFYVSHKTLRFENCREP